MNNDGCIDVNCAYHERQDCAIREPLMGTGVDDIKYVTYVGEFAVVTVLTLNAPQQMAVNLSRVIGIGDSEYTQGLFRDIFLDVSYASEVVKVGDGTLAEAGDIPSSYKNFTSDATEAIRLHEELVVMINAGTFNGADL